MLPKLINGESHSDQRGVVIYNNYFDASLIKRIYVIENSSVNFIRGWQGHQREQRWFSAVTGAFRIRLIQIDNWENPSQQLKVTAFILEAEKLDVLHVPKGYVSSIQSLRDRSKLLVMADYALGEIKDEFRFDIDYFKI